MLAHDALGDPANDTGVALRVDRLAAYELANVLVELLDELVVCMGTANGARCRLRH
ncbi:MAG: hypothetical protein WBP61_11385 [Nocardioides sp.]